MEYVRAKIGWTGQFDRRQPGNYLQPFQVSPGSPIVSCVISPFLREVFLQLLQFSHLLKGQLKFQLDLERTNTSHVFTRSGGSWVRSTATITWKTDPFYILCSMVYVQVAIVANFSHVHQMFQASSIVDILLDKSAVHETTKSKMIIKFTGLRNVVILLSRLFALQLFVCQCMQR